MSDYEEELEPMEAVNLQGIVSALSISVGLYTFLAVVVFIGSWVAFVK